MLKRQLKIGATVTLKHWGNTYGNISSETSRLVFYRDREMVKRPKISPWEHMDSNFNADSITRYKIVDISRHKSTNTVLLRNSNEEYVESTIRPLKLMNRRKKLSEIILNY